MNKINECKFKSNPLKRLYYGDLFNAFQIKNLSYYHIHTYVLKDIYINKFSLEGSLKGFKLSFETLEKKKDTPSAKK